MMTAEGRSDPQSQPVPQGISVGVMWQCHAIYQELKAGRQGLHAPDSVGSPVVRTLDGAFSCSCTPAGWCVPRCPPRSAVPVPLFSPPAPHESSHFHAPLVPALHTHAGPLPCLPPHPAEALLLPTSVVMVSLEVLQAEMGLLSQQVLSADMPRRQQLNAGRCISDCSLWLGFSSWLEREGMNATAQASRCCLCAQLW